MQDGAIVGEGDGCVDRLQRAEAGVAIGRNSPCPVTEFFTLDELHRQPGLAAGGIQTRGVQPRDCRVLQSRQHLHFALEPLDHGARLQPRDFQGDLTGRFRLLGSIDAAHAAFADQSEDLIRANALGKHLDGASGRTRLGRNGQSVVSV